MAVMDLDALEVEVRNTIKTNLTDSTIPVFPDYPRADLSKSSFSQGRVTVEVVPATGEYLSMGATLLSETATITVTSYAQDGYTDLLRSLITEIDGIIDTNKLTFTNAEVITPIGGGPVIPQQFKNFKAIARTRLYEAWILSN